MTEELPGQGPLDALTDVAGIRVGHAAGRRARVR